MSEKNIVLIPGDGIGTEIIAAAKAVCDVAFEKANVKVNWIDKKAGGASIDAYGVPLTEDTIEACKAADAVLLGAVGGPNGIMWILLSVLRKQSLVFVRSLVCSVTCVL